MNRNGSVASGLKKLSAASFERSNLELDIQENIRELCRSVGAPDNICYLGEHFKN